MHYSKLAITMLASIFLASAGNTESEKQVLAGPYLGQIPPGMTPKPFAPGVVTSAGWEYGFVFTPDMKEAYFLRERTDTKKHELVSFTYKNNQWHEKIVSPRQGQPVISPDGKRMHLGRRYKERLQDGWTDIQSLDERFTDIRIMRMSSSKNGTYVFDEAGVPGGDGVIRYSRFEGGKRQDPQPFGAQINTGSFNAHPFIAPDESYIIWDGRRESGFGNSDIYISFRKADGSWGEAINMGDKINTDEWEAAASVTPDGKYIFFNRMVDRESGNVDIFWVSADVIEALRPEE